MKKPFFSGKPHLPRWCLGAIALIVLVAVAAPPRLHRLLIEIPYQNTIKSNLDSRASLYAKVVNEYMSAHIQRVDALSNSAATRAVLNAPPEHRQAAKELWLAEARAVLTDTREIFLLDSREKVFPLKGNYLAEMLFEAAMDGKTPPPKAAMISDWAIYIVRPVVDAGQVAGVVVVETTLHSLRQRLLLASDGLDHLILTQQVDRNKKGSVISLGAESPASGGTSMGTIIPDWQINLNSTPALIATIHRPQLSYRLIISLLWGSALLLVIILIRYNLTFITETVEVRRSSFDPRDDLFTEHYIKEATSFLEPIPNTAFAGKALKSQVSTPDREFPARVFRDYDIRGAAETEISPHFAITLGKVLGSMALEAGEDTLALASDGRLSSPILLEALCNGVLSSGCDVINIGVVPTPLLNFALQSLAETRSGIVVTASHNPAGDNGFKIIFNNHVVSSAELVQLHTRMEDKIWLSGEGHQERKTVVEGYIDAIVKDILPPTGLKVVLDCANGAASLVAPQLLRRLGCEVVELYCNLDGHFPNHAPDPTVIANLDDLIATVSAERADMGIAFDGDGDRLMAVTGTGRIVWPDEILMIFVRDVLTRSPGADVVFDVKCSRRLHNLVISHGGRPVMWKTGHAHMRNKMAESGAPVGGEFSGHLFFNDRWFGFDDGIYATARLLEIIALREQTLEDIVAAFPVTAATPEIRIEVRDEEKFTYVEALRLAGNFADGTLITIDGVRVEYRDGWGLIRASNTSPALTLRFEADTEAALQRIQGIFREQLLKLDKDLLLTF